MLSQSDVIEHQFVVLRKIGTGRFAEVYEVNGLADDKKVSASPIVFKAASISFRFSS